MTRTPRIAVLGLVATATMLITSAAADAQPREIPWHEVRTEGRKVIKQLFDQIDKIPETGLDPVDTRTKTLKDKAKIARALAEYFDFIDPREAAVHPNYAPPGMPKLPSRCTGSRRCGTCQVRPERALNKHHKLLEDLLVIYKKTMFKVERLTTLAEAAGGMSGLARLTWNLTKHGINPSRQRFFNSYDSNYNKLISRINNSLVDIADCHRKHFRDYTWYMRYGLPFFLYMRDRYKRPK